MVSFDKLTGYGDTISAVQNLYKELRFVAPDRYPAAPAQDTNDDYLFASGQHAADLGTRNPMVTRIFYGQGFVENFTGENVHEHDHVISLNVHPSKRLITDLDDYIAAYSHFVCLYKFAENAKLWRERADPVTLYVRNGIEFRGTTAENDLIGITKSHVRVASLDKQGAAQAQLHADQDYLIGEKLSAGIFMAAAPTAARVEKLLEDAQTIHPRLKSSLSSYI